MILRNKNIENYKCNFKMNLYFSLQVLLCKKTGVFHF